MSRVPALELLNVSLTYPGPPRFTALDGINLRVHQGDFLAVVGPSGAGKSSLLHVLGLLSSPTSGEMRLDGTAITADDETEATLHRGQKIGFVFQAFHLLETRTTVDNVMLPLRYQGVAAAEARRRAERALAEVGLEHRLGVRARTLSGGERQRVAIARALVTDPTVLLCDEPTGNLDSTNSATVMRLLRELNGRGRTIVLITHDEQIAATVPRVVRLLDGHVRDHTEETVGAKVGAEGHNKADPQATIAIQPGRLSALDLLDEALAGLMERGWRTTLTCVGTVLGVATLVATLGLASTASTQVSKQFDRLAATTVTATTPATRAYESQQLRRAELLNGVDAVAYLHPLQGPTLRDDPTKPDSVALSSLPIVAANTTAWRVVEPTLSWGRTFDSALAERRVAVLGAAAARQAGIHGPLGTQSVTIQDRQYMVIGVLDDVQRRPDLLLSVIIPVESARADFGDIIPVRNTEVVLATRPGAGQQIAAELPLSLLPESPAAVSVVPPPDPRALRDDVDADLTGLFVMLAGLTLLVGSVGIANTSLVAVMERIPEIGLRRALGAQRRSIQVQFLAESTLVGAVGGLIGLLVGLVAVIAVSVGRNWTPVLPRELILLAPCGGAVVGMLAGFFPARRAARTDPTVALRQ